MSPDVSVSPKSSSIIDLNEIQCKICGFPGHGLHFGVVTCRACAAFFRRFIVLDLKYKCLNNKSRCSLDKIRRSSCRHCRFQKCIQMGMCANNVQWHRDISSLSGHLKRIRYAQEQSDKEKNLHMPGPSQPKVSEHLTGNEKVKPLPSSLPSIEDYFSIEEMVRHMFESYLPEPNSESIGPLQTFLKGLKLIRSLEKSQEIEFENRLSMKALMCHNKTQARNIAILLMHCTVFERFTVFEKCRMFKSIWRSISRLERILMSVELFREECIREKLLMVSTNRAVNLNDLYFNLKGMDEESLEQMLQCFLNFSERLIEEIAAPLYHQSLSIEEQAFLILAFIFFDEEYTSENHREDCFVFLETAANELHGFYRENGIKSYAFQIMSILKIVKAMKRIHHDDRAGTLVK